MKKIYSSDGEAASRLCCFCVQPVINTAVLFNELMFTKLSRFIRDNIRLKQRESDSKEVQIPKLESVSCTDGALIHQLMSCL